jgi:hypothetical protein
VWICDSDGGEAGYSSSYVIINGDFVHLSCLDCDENDLCDGAEDCNGNFIADSCEIFSDCNVNGVPDECDIGDGTSIDCNVNGIPDDCEFDDCNTNGILDECETSCFVDIAFVVDTSGSIGSSGKLSEFCTGLLADLQTFLDNTVPPVNYRITVFGPVSTQACLTMSVVAELGNDTLDPPAPDSLFPVAPINSPEDWGLATAVVAEQFDWRAGAVRIVLPVSDEGPHDGSGIDNFENNGDPNDPCDNIGGDIESICHAIDIANIKSVHIVPLIGIAGNPSDQAQIEALATLLASETGGSMLTLTNPLYFTFQSMSSDLAATIAELRDGCIAQNDCNVNGIPDECDVASATVNDCNSNGIPDECEIANDQQLDCNFNTILDECDLIAGTSPDVNQNGIPDECDEFGCPADIQPPPFGNFEVNIDDLVSVINNLGACDPGTSCFGDISPVDTSDPLNPVVGNMNVTIDDITACLNAYGPCGATQTPSISLLRIQTMDFSSGWMDETGAVDSASATAVSTAWATFDASWDVYRVWVEVPDSTTYLDALSGSEDNNTPALITNDSGSYYNNSHGSNFPPNPALFATSGFETLAFDTYLTIGNAGSGGGSPSVQGTIDLTGDTNSKSVGWYKTGGVAPVAGGSTGWRVLVGQFTVPDGDDFCISLHITGDGINEYATVCSP